MHATDGTDSVESSLISDLESTATVDLILGTGSYVGRSEWERLQAKVDPLLGRTPAKDVPTDRLEWLARRADVFPIHLGYYVQAHRLADQRTVRAQSCYAFLRAGLPTDLPGLLRAGEAAWASALRTGWARRVLPVPGTGTPAELDAEVSREIDAMRELVVDAAVDRPNSGVNQRTLFDTAGLSEADQRTFMEQWLARTGTLAQFWSDLETTLDATRVGLFQFTIQAASFVGNHVSTLEGLQAERVAGNIAAIRDLATWSASDWDGFLVTRSVSLPDDLPGANATEQRQAYARALSHVAEDAYPTSFLRHGIARDEAVGSAPANTTHLVTFFDNNPDFDIQTSTIAVYLDQAADPWQGIAAQDQAAAKANLELVQRVFRLTPRIGRYDATKVLLDNGLGSAVQVAAYTRQEFVDVFGPLMPGDVHDPEALAGKIWDKAAAVHGTTIGLASQLALAKTQADFVPLSISGAEAFEDAPNGLAELATILGNLDYCACEHCRSVFSPAAYLADLLHFLSKRPAKVQANALEALSQRRPDLRHILLDCANTNTPLPYIDLVNEVLEATVAGGLGSSSNQTTWSAEELRIHPEHLDPAIYAGAPSTLVHPWSLPFSLTTVEARTYLAHLGVPRDELMRIFAHAIPADSFERARAGETLGLNTTETEIVAGNHAADDREFWGFAPPPADDNWAGILNGTDDAGDVGQLLRRGGTTLDELRELLSLDFIDPDGDITFQWSDSCSLDAATIAFLDAPELERLHRFSRLQRRCEIPARMLNVLLVDALGGLLDQYTLPKLADMVRLNARLRLPWDELSTFWSSVIDARVYNDDARSLYDRRFRPKDHEVSQDFDPTGDGTLFGEGQGKWLSDYLPTVLAGLEISEAEFGVLVVPESPDDAFSFANLTRLFRHVTLARALGLSIDEFVTLTGVADGLTATDPFASPAMAGTFIDLVDGIRQSGLSTDELDWLLRDRGEAHFDDEQTTRELITLARGLQTILDETAQLEDSSLDALATNLGELLDSPALDEILEIVDKTNPELPLADQHQRIDDHLGAYMEAALAKDVLVNTGSADYIDDIPGRRTWLLGQVVSYQRRRALVIDTVAERFEISAELAQMLAFTVLTQPSANAALGELFMVPFASEAQISEGIDPSAYPEEFAGWTKLAKAAALCRAFQLRADEAQWYSGRGAWLDLDALPVLAGDPAATLHAWNRLRLALSLREVFPSGELTHAQIAAAATFGDAMAIFAAHPGWDADALTAVAAAVGYVDVTVLEGELELLRLREMAETAERLGVRPDVAQVWAQATPSSQDAAAIKAAARAKHDEETWRKAAAVLRNAIREQQRDALVDTVIAQQSGLDDRDAVFSSLLIDVEMSACMMTSRIKQAISSVQLYIQRVLLHLEANEVEFGHEAIARWEWMKNYRVWEANRKVFLYPENWIEPELRLNKTPEFEALEATLMQGTLDEGRVEKALVSYLEQLDRVSKLEIVGIYRDPSWGDLWILARTAGAPHEWFVRRRSNGGIWDPWEEVPHKPDGDAVALVVRRRRVHLFWLNRHEATSGQQARQNFRISHAERSDDGWSSVKVSEPSAPRYPFAEWVRHKLQVWNLDGEVRIAVMMQADWAASVFVLEAFRFDAADRKVQYLGSNFEGSEGLSPVGTFARLISKSTIALQSGYILDQQRYLNASFTELGAEDQNGDVIDAGTWFSQGSWDALLFGKRSSNDALPALVHHPDIWDLDGEIIAHPVAYDDRVRKYLLEPIVKYESANDEGDEADPLILGNLDITNYWLCPDAAASPTLKVQPAKAEAQKLKDGLLALQIWPLGVPGEVDGLAELPSIDVYAADAWQAPVLLNQAQGDAEALADPLDVDNPNPASPTAFGLALEPLYHPYARTMVERLASRGLRGLYAPTTGDELFRQQASYDPFGLDELDLNVSIVDPDTAPVEEFDFRYDSPYGIYNWELFYHVPMLIAAKLTAEQRFDEAQHWHHYVFNPIDLVEGELGASKYWRIKPFVEQSGTLAKDQLEAMMGIGVTPAQQQQAIADFTEQVKVWEHNPFDPHAVARIRPGVYQRALLRKYLDNLIEWADNLYRRDTIESINEATMLYVLVAQLLGPRPQSVPGPEGGAKSYDELEQAGLDAFSNALIELESYAYLPGDAAKKLGCDPEQPDEPWVRVPVVSRFWYFCYPPNPELLKYWDLVADRLWKIRHCQNIDGVVRRLPLFQPPIDPALLVRATAAGVDIQSVLAELDSGLPPYRFRSVHGRAVAFTGSLRALGGELLSAIEKRDAEQLARLRSEHELELLDRVRDVRERQIDEARRGLDSLRAARATVEHRRAYYTGLAKDNPSEALSEREKRHFELAKRGYQARQAAGSLSAVGSVLGAIPQLTISASAEVEIGGLHLANVAAAAATVQGMFASGYDFHANKATLQASFNRRREDWLHQRDQAEKELARLDKDIVAAEIRLEIATRELANHDVQAEHTRELDLYMRDKFSNRELYDWMVGQLSTLYFQTYQLAFDLAKRAERAYRHELAIPAGEPIIKYGYWDSLRKGLLAGERLNHDLERLDLAYMDRDVREFELRKSVSLAELAPLALRDLQETGTCEFSMPELLFDLDHPGHYLRRLRAVRVTIPAVVGPHTSLGARLELDEHSTRVSADPTDYADQEVAGRFVIGYGGGEAIATSTAVSDGGLFNLDFRDERYLPFEYAGAISSWKLSLPQQVRQFDYRTISDVVIHLDYTARDGGADLRSAAESDAQGKLATALSGEELTQIVVVHEAFPNEWEQFLAPDAAATVQTLTLPIEAEHFPYFAQRGGIEISQVDFALLLEESVTSVTNAIDTTLTMTAQASDPTPSFDDDPNNSDAPYLVASSGPLSPDEAPGTWALSRAKGQAPQSGDLDYPDGWLDRDKVEGLVMIIRYTLA